MKKKTIEKIPYLGLPGAGRKKTAGYVGVTAIRDIGGESHLFLEVYRKDSREVPVARIVLNRKEHGTYFPGKGTWTGKYISEDEYGGRMVWDSGRGRKASDVLAAENVLYSGKDLERIREYTGVRDKNFWWRYIREKQQEIMREARRKRREQEYERRKKALEERMAGTPGLPEERILGYADQCLFQDRHHLYYRKRGARAEVACSACGNVTEGRWKPGISYEGQYQRMLEEPAENHAGTCPACGKRGTYIPQGKERFFSRKTASMFLGQKYGEKGMVIRYIDVQKEWQLEQTCGEKGLEMCWAGEKMCCTEVARIYFEPGKKVQKDFHKYNPYSGRDFWDDCNLYGNGAILIGDGKVMPETYRNMEGTFLQYSAMEEYQGAAGGDMNPADYLERYIQTPQIEMLVKTGLYGVVKELVGCRYGIVADENAERPDGFLGIRKERVRQLAGSRCDMALLKMMQLEKRLGCSWTAGQLEQAAELGTGCGIGVALEYMGIQKLLNRVEKYAGCGYGTGCSAAAARLRHTAQTYTDYLGLRKELGYDMGNTVFLFPRDLWKAHAGMVAERNREEADRRIREAEEKYPLIRKHYRKLRKKFYYGDEEYTIRPARSAREIVEEGRALHHCVGGDTYLDRHNRNRSTILFLRYRSEPDTPYVTVEIGTDTLEIRQWYGEGDKKPDRDRIQKWLDAYVARLKCAGTEAGTGGGQDILAYA